VAIYSAGSASVQIVPDFRGATEAIQAWYAAQGDLHINVVPDLAIADLERIRRELQAVQAEIRPRLSGVDTAAAQATLNGLSAEVQPQVGTVDTAAAQAQLNSLEGTAVVHVLLDAVSMERVHAELNSLEGTATIHVKVDGAATQAALNAAVTNAAGSAAGSAAGGDGGAGSAITAAGGSAALRNAAAAAAGSAAGNTASGGGGDRGGGGGAGAFLGAAALGPIAAVGAGAAALSPFGGGGPQSHLLLHAIPLVGDMLPALGALGVVPALMTSIGASMIVTKLATDNMAVAFKGLSDSASPAQLQAALQAIQAMPPAAQQFVTTLAPLQKSIDTNLVKPIQQAFYQGLGPAVKDLYTTALPLMQKGMVGVAQSTNQSLLLVVHQLIADTTQFSTIWDNIDKARAASVPVLRNLVQIFVQFATVGSQFLPQMAQHMTTLTQKWLDWTNHAAATGELFNIIQRGMTTIHEITALLVNLGKIFFDIFNAAQVPGQNMLQLLIQLTGSLAAFLKAPPGADALKNIFTALHTEANAVVPLIGDFIQRVILAAGHIVGDLQPALTVFFNALTRIYNALKPVWDAMLALIDAVLPPLVKLFVALVPPLTDFVVQIAGLAAVLIEKATPYLVTFVNWLVDHLMPIIKDLGPKLGDIAAAVIAWKNAQALLNGVMKPINFVIEIAKGAYGAALAIISGATKAWAAAQWLLNAAMDANPIVWVIGALALLGLAIYELVTHWKEVTGFLTDRWNSAWAYITSTASAAWGKVVSAWNTFTGFLTDRWNSAWAYITGTVSGVGNALQSAWNTVTGFLENRWNSAWAYISGIASSVWGSISGFFVNAWNQFTGFFKGIWDNVTAYWSLLWNTRFKQPVTEAWTAISTFFQVAWAAFTSYFQGIWNGISGFFTARWNEISSTAQAIWSAIENFFIARWETFKANWTAVWNAVSGFFTTIWNGISSFAQTIWTAISGWFVAQWNILQTQWSVFWNTISAFFTTIWNGISAFAQTIWNAISGWFVAQWNILQTQWSVFWTTISVFFGNIWNGISSTAQNIWNGISGFFTTAWSVFTTAWNGFWDGVGAKFNQVWSGIKSFASTVWEEIKGIVATPINFVIDTILNNGLFKAWNAVNDFLYLPWHINPLNKIPGFSEGGYTGDRGLFGTGAPEDPAGLVHAGEFVHTQDKTKQWLPLFQLIHAGAIQPSDLGLPGFAGGGLAGTPQSLWTWPELNQIRQKMFPGSILTDAYRPGANDYHGAGQAIDIGWPGNDPAHLAQIAAALGRAFPGMTEGIHNPNLSIKNGRVVPSSFWGAATWAEHANHVHWAETPGDLSKGNATPGGASLLTVAGNAINSVGDIFSSLGSSISGPIGQLMSQFNGNSKWVQILGALPKKLLDGLWNKVKDAVGSAWNTISAAAPVIAGIGGGSAAQVNTAGIKAEAFQIAGQQFGWPSVQAQQALDYIASHESGWNPTAKNPSSTASGLWQLIDSTWQANKNAGPWPTAGSAPTAEQDTAAFRYIRNRFGDPIAAQQYWAVHHNYDTGGIVPPGWNTLYNGTGRNEVMLNPPQLDRLNNILDGRGNGGGQMLRDLNVSMQSANPYEVADEIVYRLKVASRGGVYSTVRG
jgi:phage-related protein